MDNDIPEEIRKMFPNMPIHKLDIDPDGNLQVLASSEPLSNEPDFENMPIEQVNQYLRDHGYDPEQVGLRGKILTDALIENIHLRERAEAAEQKLRELQAKYDGLFMAAYAHVVRDMVGQSPPDYLLELANELGLLPVPPEAENDTSTD